VAYRDFRYVLPFLVQVWMFATPSVYMQIVDEPAAVASRPAPAPSVRPTDPPQTDAAAAGAGRPSVGPLIQATLALNPMTGLIQAFRASVLGGPIPWARLAASSACAMLAFIIGCIYFRRVEDTFADII